MFLVVVIFVIGRLEWLGRWSADYVWNTACFGPDNRLVNRMTIEGAIVTYLTMRK